LSWLLIGAATFALISPQGAAAALRNAPAAAQAAWNWRLPQRAGRAAAKGFAFIFPTQPAPKGSAKVPIESELWARSAVDSGAVANDTAEESRVEPVQASLFPEPD